MKKLLALLSVLAILATCCIMGIGTVAFAAEESSEEDFLVFDGVLEEYVGAGGDVVIPASLGVKEIAANAFENNNDITSVVIPEGVEVVGYWSFRNCKSLESITLPYSLTELAEHCFSGAPITEITIPGNVERVGYGAFSGCEYLEELTLSYGVKEIMVLAFQGTSMQKVVFPETVELICGGASFGHNKNANIGKIEYYICNPDCEIGVSAGTSAKANKYQWETESSPWSHNKGNATYNIYVVEDSEVEKTLNEKGRAWLDAVDSGKEDGLKIIDKPQSYFDELEENQEGYGTQKPGAATITDPVDDPENPEDNGGNGGSSNDKDANGSKGGNTTTVVKDGDSSTSTMLIVIVCVFGGIMLIAIIVVVILAATGKLFGGKKKADAPAAADDIEALKAKLEAAELRAKLEALEGKAAPAEEAPAAEPTAEDAE